MKKKQPKKVQISKQNLTELLGVLKNFIVEELLETSKKDNSRMDLIYKSLFNLEAAQKNLNSQIRDLRYQLSCGVEVGHQFSVQYIQAYDVVFRCVKCKFDYTKSKYSLSKKEKKLLRIVSKGRK